MPKVTADMLSKQADQTTVLEFKPASDKRLYFTLK